MRHRIFSYSSVSAIVLSISLLLLFSIASEVAGQTTRPTYVPKRDQNRAKKEEAKLDTIPLFYEAYVGVDVFGVGGKLFGSDFLSTEVSVTANLKNKFLPTLELGYGSTDAWNETGIHYKSSAPYFRIGADYNTMSKKKDKNSYLFVGARYGISSFKYSINNLAMNDPIWGDAITNPSLEDGIWGGANVPFHQDNLKSTMHWFELVAGVKVNIYRNFNMGWTIRMKYKISASVNEYADPWYVPGFGKYKSSNIGITYSLIYKLPIQTK
ncbi:DUF6048 family protein [Bacteroides sp.]|uniref:DUF6048 family protein n=1 Tax=Bacteroides sp. TaxID=29523 RepID=UPI001B77B687|nr:DUF6048 family protein [Bacteroides sp.]MBP8623045.1 hypothetical protein [Bacteroides sp.]